MDDCINTLEMIPGLDDIPEFDEDGVKTIMLPEMSSSISIGAASVIGSRKSQQDKVLADSGLDYLENTRAIAVLCDGMGGLQGGERASGTCAELLFRDFHELPEEAEIPMFYKKGIARADQNVSALTCENGERLNAGTTLCSVVIAGNSLYWACVGDSRLYIFRRDEILQINKDHNYAMLLAERVKRGQLSAEAAAADPKREALVSFIGMGGVRYVDMNSKPAQLRNGDKLLLCSDGLYRALTEEQLRQIITIEGIDAQTAADALTEAALSMEKKHQDNTSAIVIYFYDSAETDSCMTNG